MIQKSPCQIELNFRKENHIIFKSINKDAWDLFSETLHTDHKRIPSQSRKRMENDLLILRAISTLTNTIEADLFLCTDSVKQEYPGKIQTQY